MVSFGQSSGPIEPFSPGLLAQKGSLFLTRPTLFHYIATRDELEQSRGRAVRRWSRSGKVKIEIKQRFPLTEPPRRTARWKRARRPARPS